MPVQTQWTITYEQCGHTETKDLSAKPAAKRAGFAKWLTRNRTCRACWRAQNGKSEWVEDKEEWLAKKRAEEDQTAADWAEHVGMPALDGTEKQVAWANRIRHQAMIALHSWAVQEEHAAEEFDAAEETARTIDQARWWLDQREQITDDPQAMLELLQSAADEGITCENTY